MQNERATKFLWHVVNDLLHLAPFWPFLANFGHFRPLPVIEKIATQVKSVHHSPIYHNPSKKQN